MSYLILWPERCYVSVAKMTGWYQDAVANGELEDGDENYDQPDQMATALDRAGLITLGSENRGRR